MTEAGVLQYTEVIMAAYTVQESLEGTLVRWSTSAEKDVNVCEYLEAA